MSFEVSKKTLERLEWTEVLGQLRDQCRTPQGRLRFGELAAEDERQADSESAQKPAAGHWSLPLESSLAGTRKSLSQTSEARALLDVPKHPPLGGAIDLRQILGRVEREGLVGSQELLALASTLAVIHATRRFMTNEQETAPELWELAEGIETQESLESEIRKCIDESGEISDRASRELATARSDVGRLTASLQKRLQEALQNPAIAPHLSDSFVTVRNDRYVLPVRADARGHVPGIVHDASNSGTTLFIEPQAVVELNNRLKQAELEVARICQQILRALNDRARRALPEILRATDALGRIDLAFARGHLSQNMDAVEPRVEPNGEFETLQLRHPLLPESVAVANDFHLGKQYSVLILSGPNAGGKTVAMKSLGLAAIFVRAGLHVPALPGARVALVDRVLADIGDEQDIRESLSTFSAHMANLAEIVQVATSNSLVLLDEVGVGTDPGEGAAIAQAILESLADRGTRCIATTHYSLLKELAAIDERFCNASVDYDPDTLAPTYRLRFGVAGASSATTVAARMGMPTVLLERANSLLEREDRQLDKMLGELSSSRAALERERLEASALRLESETARNEYQLRLERLQERRDQLFQKMRGELDQAFESAHEQIASVIRALQQGGKEATARDAARARQELLALKQKANTDERTRPQETPEPHLRVDWQQVQPGDPIAIIGGTEGVLETLPDRKGRVAVRAGGARLLVDAERVARVNPAQANPGPAQARKKSPAGPAHDHQELGGGTLHCDLRGLRVEEALERADAELDRGTVGNHSAIEFVHGFGTGALRKALRRHLASSPYVFRIETGDAHHGGDGVTLAVLDEKHSSGENPSDE